MSTAFSVAEVLAKLEERIAYHRQQADFHAQQEVHHREQNALHLAELKNVTEHFEAFKATALPAAELAGQSAAPPQPVKEEEVEDDREFIGKRILASRLVARTAERMADGVTFGGKQVAAGGQPPLSGQAAPADRRPRRLRHPPPPASRRPPAPRPQGQVQPRGALHQTAPARRQQPAQPGKVAGLSHCSRFDRAQSPLDSMLSRCSFGAGSLTAATRGRSIPARSLPAPSVSVDPDSGMSYHHLSAYTPTRLTIGYESLWCAEVVDKFDEKLICTLGRRGLTMRRVKVRLTTDLTKYHSSLVMGTEGYTADGGGFWSRASDRFVSVAFPEAGILDVLWDSLEITDPEYLAEAAALQEDRRETLRSATNVVRTVGPRGGFKYLSYEFVGRDGVRQHVSTGFRSEAEALVALFQSYGIAIEERKL